MPHRSTRLLTTLAAFFFAMLAAGCSGDGRAQTGETDAAAAERAANCAPNNDGLTLPDGFCAEVVADSVGPARHLAVRENGDLYVALREVQREATQSEGEGALVALRDTTGDGRADVIRYFGGDAGGTGMHLRDGYLYASTTQAVRRYPLSDGQLVPDAPAETIVENFPEQDQHAAKSLAFDEQGQLYVNIGAPSNACQEPSRTAGVAGQDPCPLLEEHSGVWRFSADQPGQQAQSDGTRYVTGVRNAVALTWNAADDALYLVQHGRDQLHQFWPDLYTEEQSAELPAEEFVRAEEGTNLGWPYCYYDQQKEQKVLSPEYGGDGTEVGRCAQFATPLVGFPGHWAPNDVLFYTGDRFPERYQGGAFIAFHGSWNRAPLPQQGYRVAFVPFEGGQPATGDWETFANGFAGADTLRSPGAAEYRPMGLAVGPEGALYIADSQKGRIWRIRPTDRSES